MVVPEGIDRLCGEEMRSVPQTLTDCWLEYNEAGIITDYGSMASLGGNVRGDIDAAGGCVLPAFCDSHTHIIYAGSREGEWIDKIHGLSYEEVARRGGGILNSADKLAAASEESLYTSAAERLAQMVGKGTGAVEIKTGYGLDTPNELKMLRVAARLREESPAEVRVTFLGAHAVGRAYTGRQTEYVQMLINEMMPAIAAEGIADYVDVFCDTGFFTPDETARILDAGARYGLRPKIHANELGVSGGVQVGVRHGAVSVDHLEQIGQEEIDVLAASSTIPTALPGASFFSRLPYAPARAMIDAGLPLALASDYNPGSSPSGDMRFVWALGCNQMRLDPLEALAACTINGAAAMELGATYGAIAPGRKAALLISRRLPSPDYIPYAYTEPWLETVILP